jgi:hypothetical protein
MHFLYFYRVVKAWTEVHFLHEALLLFNKMYVVQRFHEPIVVKAWTEVHFLLEALLLFNKMYVVQLFHEPIKLQKIAFNSYM